MKTRLFFSSLLACTLFAGMAQNGYTTYTCNAAISSAISAETGMLTDNQGTKWISFRSYGSSANVGLVKHSNGNSTLYSTATTPALPSNSVMAIALDNSGNIWLGSNMGLTRLNPANNTIVNYNTSSGLPSNHVLCLDTYGSNLYVGTSGGLSVFDGSNFTNYNVGNGKLPFDVINSIEAENASLIWLGGNALLAELDIVGSTSSFINHPIGIATGTINCIYNDGAGMRWLGTTISGLLGFNGTSFSDARTMFTMYGTKIPDRVNYIGEGLHGGIAIRGDVGNVSVGGTTTMHCILELAPGGKVYQYFANSQQTLPGDFIYKEGGLLHIAQGGPSQGYNPSTKNLFYTFDESQYNPFNKGAGVNNNNVKLLDINQVSAGITNRGDMHWGIGSDGGPMYEVPKNSGRSTNYATSLWISGYDNNNVLHTDAQTYRQNGSAFWPGPLDTVNVSSVNTAPQYDKIWKVSYADINDFSTNFANGNVQNGSFVPNPDLINWPAHGSGNVSRNLAPFVDVNNNGIYDPLVGGDYPKIKGDQALYYIFNDSYSATTTASCTAFGFEVQAMAYAYGCPSSLQGHPELAYTTFYDYKIINRSPNNYHGVSVALWTDADLGYYGDDYIGTNVQDNYTYIYNSDGFDESASGTIGYGNYPPAQGFAFMRGALADIGDATDNDNDGLIDEPGEEALLNHSTYFLNSFPGVPIAQTDPQACNDYMNYMTSKWRDGTIFTCGGNGYGGSSPTWARFVYPGTSDPNGCNNWTEASAGNIPGDRRIVMSSAGLSFAPGETKEIEYAFVTSFDSTVANAPLNSVAKLQTDIQHLRAFYTQTTKPNCYATTVPVGIHDMAAETLVSLFPNPASESVTVRVANGDMITSYELMDLLGKTVLSSTDKHSGQLTVPVSQLKSGVYFLKLNINSKQVVKKIVKE